MNVKANKTLTDLSFVKSLNVPPSGGDESLCIGGCYMIENNKKIHIFSSEEGKILKTYGK